MGERVRDRDGDVFEIRPARAAGGSRRPSLREAVDRRASLHAALDDPDNHEAFVRVLQELDPLRATVDLDRAQARALVLAALASGELELVRSRQRFRPVADVLTETAAPLTELADDDEDEVAATYTFEFELVDAASNPVPFEPYRVELPDGQVVEGRLNARGAALITGITTPGNCTLTFPNRTDDEWAAI